MTSTVLGSFGTSQLLVIIALGLLLFGGKKIPELMKGLGIGLREFKKATQGEAEEAKKTEQKYSDDEKKNKEDLSASK
ncbi:Sec-independent protein translocase subunit TatA/TatB [Bacteroidetes bacterium endosymbiont of Geopemphigus sp.]|uniref:Sec-independent protein translocase subunit TatA/TatB n=1 Tax=Bacteroidetes bacterium endosymbiont of Geopemphigus sp. TaxID=2047937 RepID=UPI000CD25167|nr:twin-arginine translocase TatA/TatE family subunit [Bacteroidetes bacterium endosymbiont of Geopemphigus sp.]